MKYQLCVHCDHFVGDNPAYGDYPGIARYEHYEDGEQEFDHDAKPSYDGYTLDEWRIRRPDLFYTYPDGKIGPNSRFHSRRGKADGA